MASPLSIVKSVMKIGRVCGVLVVVSNTTSVWAVMAVVLDTVMVLMCC